MASNLVMSTAPTIQAANDRLRHANEAIKRLYERTKRLESEQRFLAEVGAVLASTLDYEKTLTSIARLAVRDLADVCIVDVFEESGEIRRLRTISRDPALEWACEVLTKMPIDRSQHIARPALESKRPVLVEELTPELITSFAQGEERLEALRAIDPRSAIMVPLVTRDQVVGLITFLSSSRKYAPRDLRLADELAWRGGLSIENARLYRAAHRAVQARDEVLGIVVHDLRNLLQTILMQLQLFKRHGGELERRSQQPMEMILRSATRMNRLIQDLLDVTRMEAGRLTIKRDRIPVSRFIAELTEVQKPLAAAASVELIFDVAGVPDVWADRDRLFQIFENLVGNAIKFTESGGTITIGARPQGGEVLFWLADTGAGISAENVPHVFDRFWQARTTERRLGTGLGLPIVKGLVEAHGGRIWVESAIGRGTTFFFTIPAALETRERLGALAATAMRS
jgi:signal transduction histidine kinase